MRSTRSLLVAVMIAIIETGCASRRAPAPPTDPLAEEIWVNYEVTGTADSADVEHYAIDSEIVTARARFTGKDGRPSGYAMRYRAYGGQFYMLSVRNLEIGAPSPRRSIG